MPWLSILIALLTYFLSKKNGASTGEAIGYSALAGGATYAFTHSDMMEGTTLASLDGVESVDESALSSPTGTTPITDASGEPVPNVNIETGTSSLNPAIADIAPSLATLATGAVIGSTSDNSFWMWATIGLGLFILMSD